VYPKEFKAGSKGNTCMSMFTTALFPIAKRWVHPRCHREMNEKVSHSHTHTHTHTHTGEYYSFLKCKEILAYATTWLNVKDTLLNEISPVEKKIL
jgi:hypothetical protein